LAASYFDDELRSLAPGMIPTLSRVSATLTSYTTGGAADFSAFARSATCMTL
jgi:hypothetical protein